MSSYIEIANMAAVKIGTESRLTSPDDDKVLARRVKAVWDMQRRAAIRDGAWNFAMKREALPELVDTAVRLPWSSVFKMPADALRLVDILNVEARGDYQLEGGRVLCNLPGPLYIRYLADIENPALWDETFADAFAARIAWKIGKAIAGSSYSERGGEAEYRQILAEAKRVDALENPPIQQAEDEWVEARFGYRFDDNPMGMV